MQEWNGAFSDKSDAWTPGLKKAVGADDADGEVRLVLFCLALM